MKRNHTNNRAPRNGVAPYTRAKRNGTPKVPCAHCQQITRDLKRSNNTGTREEARNVVA